MNRFQILCLLILILVFVDFTSATLTRYDYVRGVPECNKQCISKTPIAGLTQCCKNHFAAATGFGFCSKHNQAICGSWTEEYTVIG